VGYTKGDLVRVALSELGIADYEFDITPEEISFGVRKMDWMMSQWSLKGIRAPYNFIGGPADDSGLPMAFYEAVALNLALRLAPSYGKQPAMSVMTGAKQALDAIMSKSALPPEIQFPSMPIGAGYKSTEQRFSSPSVQVNDVFGSDDFQDFSDSSTAIQQGDVGTLIQIDVSGTADLSSAIDLYIKYRKPSGKTGQWTATLNDPFIEYYTQAGDMDESGVWYLQAFFDLTTWQGSSKIVSITVGRSL
jgi:hypothetical protein